MKFNQDLLKNLGLMNFMWIMNSIVSKGTLILKNIHHQCLINLNNLYNKMFWDWKNCSINHESGNNYHRWDLLKHLRSTKLSYQHILSSSFIFWNSLKFSWNHLNIQEKSNQHSCYTLNLYLVSLIDFSLWLCLLQHLE